jgi:signal transduction histidine kinase
MATAFPVRRARPRLGLAAGLTAAVRGLAFSGLMLAGLGLMLAALAALGLAALSVALVVQDQGQPHAERALVLLVLVVAAGLVLGRIFASAVLAGLRRVAIVTRRLAGEWCGVPIADPYRAPGGRADTGLSRAERLRWMLGDGATWRDLIWVTVNILVGWILAAASAIAVGVGTVAFLVPALTKAVPPPAFPGNTKPVIAVLGLAIIVTGVAAAPWLLRAYGLLAHSMLAPPGDAELTLRVRQLSQTRAEALDTGAAEIRRIERDLHDGAQARLVAMGMTLDAAGQIIDTNPDAARALLVEARDASVKALAELRDLVRGIHPPVLADRGLADAIRALALDSPMRIDLASDMESRPPAPVESAAYFAVSELLANVSKHAEARQTWIDIRHTEGMLRIGVTDNGHGGADPARGSGLRGIERRLAPFDGVLAIISPPGGPTAVTMEVPCALSSPKTSSC